MLFDTSTWIEFFRGTERGKKVRQYFKTEENFTGIITLAEITNWRLKNELEDKFIHMLMRSRKLQK
jgi:predicted nucleic acid-binding protein